MPEFLTRQGSAGFLSCSYRADVHMPGYSGAVNHLTRFISCHEHLVDDKPGVRYNNLIPIDNTALWLVVIPMIDEYYRIAGPMHHQESRFSSESEANSPNWKCGPTL